MKVTFREIEKLLPGYLSCDLSDTDRSMIDEWRKESPENEELYLEILNAWDAIPLLHEMEQFNSFKALEKVNSRIFKSHSKTQSIKIRCHRENELRFCFARCPKS